MTSNELIEKQISSVRRNTTSTTQIYSTKHVEEKANLSFPYLQHPKQQSTLLMKTDGKPSTTPRRHPTILYVIQRKL